VAGYLTRNDVSERAFQFEHGGTVGEGVRAAIRSVQLATGCSLGIELYRKLQQLDMWLEVNGKRYPRGATTNTMVFGVARLVSSYQSLH